MIRFTRTFSSRLSKEDNWTDQLVLALLRRRKQQLELFPLFGWWLTLALGLSHARTVRRYRLRMAGQRKGEQNGAWLSSGRFDVIIYVKDVLS